MATQTIIVLECDNCGRESTDDRPVARHRAKVDSNAIVNVDACDRCWEKASKNFLALLEKGEKEAGSRRWRL